MKKSRVIQVSLDAKSKNLLKDCKRSSNNEVAWFTEPQETSVAWFTEPTQSELD